MSDCSTGRKFVGKYRFSRSASCKAIIRLPNVTKRLCLAWNCLTTFRVYTKKDKLKEIVSTNWKLCCRYFHKLK